MPTIWCVHGLTAAIFHGIFRGMSATVTMDSSGRLIIPRNIREQLHLGGGSRLNLEIKGDGVFLAPLPSESAQIVKSGGRLVIESTARLSNDAVRMAIVGDRNARSDKLSNFK